MPASPGTAAAAPAQRSPREPEPLLVLEAVEAHLDRLGHGSGPVRARQIGDGHSNVTFELVRAGTQRLVLRRPPRPPYPASAHDVVREAHLLHTVARHGVRVPPVLDVCEDDSVLGAPFLLMSFVDGHVLTTDVPPEIDAPGVGTAIGAELVDALAELHAVDVAAPDIAALGRPQGYLVRQLRRFSAIWEDVRTREVPGLDRVAAWLHENVPVSASSSVVHGDYRLGNVILSSSVPPRLVAVLDWEMAALGDPLADLGYLTATWAGSHDEDNAMLALSAVTRRPDFPTADDLVERYTRTTDRDVSALRWYQVLALWKSAVFLEASYRRWLSGTTDDAYFSSLSVGVPAVAREAERRTRMS